MKNVSTKINVALLLIGLAFGAQSFGQQPSGEALIDAVQNEDVAQVKKLIAEGANVNTVAPGYGTTPLMLAATVRNPEMVKMLLDKGAKVNVADRRGITPLWEAVHEMWGMDVDKKDTIEVVKMLLSKGANVNARNFLGQTVLGEAARRNNPELMKMLLAKKPKVNIPDSMMGMTPLMFAAEVGNPEVVKMLLDAGAKVNSLFQGGTPLMVAAEVGNPEIVKMLLAAGADKTIKIEGKTAADMAKTPAIRDLIINYKK